MYQPTPAGEAFQVNGVWNQDYTVQDSNGVISVKRFIHNGSDWVEASVQAPAQAKKAKIDFTKSVPNTEAGISLKKNIINLDKCIVDLSKDSGIDMGVHSAKVAVVLDFSGSMSNLYKSGAVQRALSRLVPLGLKFDDNGEVDVWLFHNDYIRMEGINLENFENYIKEEVLNGKHRYGGTSYSPVINDVMKKYIHEEPSKYPAFVIFITDGENNDKRPTNNAILESSKYNMFVQFVGIGRDCEFEYLKRLDDLKGRPVDNTGFIEVNDFDKMSDDRLYHELLVQYIDWLKALGVK